MKWLEYQFLDAPFQNLCDLELVFGGAGDLVNPAELAELLTGLSKDDKDCSFEREFVGATGKVIRALEKLGASERFFRLSLVLRKPRSGIPSDLRCAAGEKRVSHHPTPD